MFFRQPASLPSFLETGFFTEPEVHPLGLAGLPGNSWNSFSLPLTLEGYKHVHLCLAFYVGAQRFKLRSSGYAERTFTP